MIAVGLILTSLRILIRCETFRQNQGFYEMHADVAVGSCPALMPLQEVRFSNTDTASVEDSKSAVLHAVTNGDRQGRGVTDGVEVEF